ncbi:MAG: hypothetical protein Faunusvirus25_2 [Faunusvirus sp.]|jgi:ankyrin repeat protein|uniref:Uncharacterized protein n=1 Tax=Faunusvirus sp. TaxID=2487766 RepID=A0A3G4ZZ51_9VIRU|nr:MAG: hypothetical protein Faunusvirus25_2 [Faunusvirus sp.]
MSLIETHRDKFMKLVQFNNENKCIEYINKYDDFYNAIYRNNSHPNMLQLACAYRMDNVAIALIDKKCDLTYQDIDGYTAMMIASCFGLKNVVAYIINNSTDIITRTLQDGESEILYLHHKQDVDNIIRMIDRGYNIYHETVDNRTLFTSALSCESERVVKKLIDIDTDFIEEFEMLYYLDHMGGKFCNNIAKYCVDKYDGYKHEIIAAMNDTSPTNILYQSFRNTYAVELVDIICDFILLKLKI